MSISDTAEYWNDIKDAFKRSSFNMPFTHLKDRVCGHYHKYETDKVEDVDCHACMKTFSEEERAHYEKIERKREKNRRHRRNIKRKGKR